MKTDRFYKIIIILLLLLNIGTLGYLLLNKNGSPKDMKHRPPKMRNEGGHKLNSIDRVIIDKLDLDEEQQQKFSEYKREHRKSTDSVQRTIRDIQKELFSLVKEKEMNVQVRDSLLAIIEESESAKHLITIDHFHDLRSMMRPEQVESFNEFMEDIGSRITGPGMPPQPPRPPRH